MGALFACFFSYIFNIVITKKFTLVLSDLNCQFVTPEIPKNKLGVIYDLIG